MEVTSVSRRLFQLCLGSFYVLLVGALMTAITRGHPVAAIMVVLVSSPVAMVLVAWKLEPKGRVRQVLNPRSQSWMFLFGDSLGLTTTAAALAVAWCHMPDGWYTSVWWALASAVIGIVGGDLYHYVDSGAYKAAGAQEALKSPTKQVHDRLTYSVLLGGLVYGGVPVLIEVWSHPGMHFPALVALGGVVIWILCGVRDIRAKLDPNKLHPLTSKLK